jgi:hypothetical protein
MKELASYQKTQLRDVVQTVKHYQDIEISNAIRRTLDGILLEEIDLINKVDAGS